MIINTGNLSSDSGHILPEKYPHHGNWEEKSLFVLSKITQGSAAEIAGEIAEVEHDERVLIIEERVEEALTRLHENGMLKGELSSQVMIYCL